MDGRRAGLRAAPVAALWSASVPAAEASAAAEVAAEASVAAASIVEMVAEKTAVVETEKSPYSRFVSKICMIFSFRELV